MADSAMTASDGDAAIRKRPPRLSAEERHRRNPTSPVDRLGIPVVNGCADHTYGPSDYVGWHEWAEEKSKTHTQTKCPECGMYLIWEESDGV